MTTLITGSAGFIGYHLSKALCERGDIVIGIDNLNNSYDVNLKNVRLNRLGQYQNFTSIELDITHRESMKCLFHKYEFKNIVNLAAYTDVNYSLHHPHVVIETNTMGFLNILELCRDRQIENIVFASSSAVYGTDPNQYFSEEDPTDNPISLYAVSKKTNELTAHCYAKTYGFPCTGLRFFNVYGPWASPNMVLYKFTNSILADKTIDVHNHGDMIRDFVYVDDVVKCIMLTLDNPKDYSVYNVGSNNPITLIELVDKLETLLNKKAKKNMLPEQDGFIRHACADNSRFAAIYNYKPTTKFDTGLKEYIAWYLSYYSDKQT